MDDFEITKYEKFSAILQNLKLTKMIFAFKIRDSMRFYENHR